MRIRLQNRILENHCFTGEVLSMFPSWLRIPSFWILNESKGFHFETVSNCLDGASSLWEKSAKIIVLVQIAFRHDFEKAREKCEISGGIVECIAHVPRIQDRTATESTVTLGSKAILLAMSLFILRKRIFENIIVLNRMFIIVCPHIEYEYSYMPWKRGNLLCFKISCWEGKFKFV